ncbi:MAG: murein biosynthesis integral membrane protein MurJ [Actinobacteria bacterium]|jgi:putative peptidoglycan lipid II flippase|nr:murein biosynthesis integral membrane protein MurJ [Actinomycetota bacterium]
MGNETNSNRRRLATAAAFLMAATAGSRILGLIREVIANAYLGMGAEMGAYTQAIKVPNLVRTLLADTALSAAFIPVFSGLLEKKRSREAWQVAFTVTVAATLALGVVTVLGVVFAPAIIKVVSPGWVGKYPESVALAAHLMQIMFPTVLVMGIAGIFMGILNSYDHFSMPAIAPIVWNVIIIIVVAVFSDRYGFEALAWGVMLGTLAEFFLLVPFVWKRRWRRGVVAPDQAVVADEPSPWRLALRSPEVKKIGILLGPVILSLGIVNFNAFIGTIVASLIGQAAPAYIDKAFRLYQLPQGMFAIAIGTVLFPALSRHGAAKRMAEFRADLSLGIRQIFFVTLPFAAFFSVLSEPTVRLIYEYGKVVGDEAAISGTSSALLFYSLGMAFVSVNTLLNRAFYSIQKSWVPLVMGAANLAVNAAIMLFLYESMGVGGITLATSVVSIINFFGLMVLLSPRIGGLDARRIAWSAGRSIIALIPLVGVAYGVWYGLDVALGGGLWQKIVSVLVAYAAGGGVYIFAAWAMRMPELRDVLNVIRRRRHPRETDEVIDLEGRS